MPQVAVRRDLCPRYCTEAQVGEYADLWHHDATYFPDEETAIDRPIGHNEAAAAQGSGHGRVVFGAGRCEKFPRDAPYPFESRGERSSIMLVRPLDVVSSLLEIGFFFGAAAVLVAGVVLVR